MAQDDTGARRAMGRIAELKYPVIVRINCNGASMDFFSFTPMPQPVPPGYRLIMFWMLGTPTLALVSFN